MPLTSYVAYYRVSTAAQGHSGLGLEAQRASIQSFLSGSDRLLAEFVEIQSGRKDNRTELAKAVSLAKGKGASILIARLDRFSRRVSFIAGMMESGVRLTIAELPNATEFQLHIFAALAQEERRLISERTRLALKQAKGRGVSGWARTGSLWLNRIG
ncbi:recombinase family protein [Enterovirga sp. CN4-39]|uniref:recombinase family protein n=1 Tax=Enterovirga sp. CN4-39 TaxID=3400910 RepID=UPI003C0432B5